MSYKQRRKERQRLSRAGAPRDLKRVDRRGERSTYEDRTRHGQPTVVMTMNGRFLGVEVDGVFGEARRAARIR